MHPLVSHDVQLVSGVSLPLSFFDGSTSAMSILREDGLLLYRNQATTNLFPPYSGKPEDLIGKNILDLQPRAFFEERARVMRRLAKEGRDGVIRDIWDGKQILTRLRLLPPQPGQPLRAFLAIHQPQGGEATSPDVPEVLFHDAEHQDLGPLALLSPRELEVLALVGQGLTASQIAARLHRSEDTVNSHRASLLRKLNCQNAVQLGVIAYKAGLKASDAARFA